MRAIWSGTISFGLVSVPVRMFSATESKELRFNFLDRRDMSPIGYEKVSKESGEAVPQDEIVRGFEIEKGQFVPIEDADLDRLDIELTHSIDICDFVDLTRSTRSTSEGDYCSRRRAPRSRIAFLSGRSKRPGGGVAKA